MQILSTSDIYRYFSTYFIIVSNKLRPHIDIKDILKLTQIITNYYLYDTPQLSFLFNCLLKLINSWYYPNRSMPFRLTDSDQFTNYEFCLIRPQRPLRAAAVMLFVIIWPFADELRLQPFTLGRSIQPWTPFDQCARFDCSVDLSVCRIDSGYVPSRSARDDRLRRYLRRMAG